MNKLIIVGAWLPVLAFSSAAVLAQDIDFDDITMTVVGEGMFEARQLPRPSSDAIREFMDANLGEPPGQEGPGQESPIHELPPQFDTAPPAPVVFQQPPELRSAGDRHDTQSVREVIEPDNQAPVSDMRNQRPSPRDQRNERPTPPQRPGNRG